MTNYKQRYKDALTLSKSLNLEAMDDLVALVLLETMTSPFTEPDQKKAAWKMATYFVTDDTAENWTRRMAP